MHHLCRTVMAFMCPTSSVDEIVVDFGHGNPLDAFVLVDILNNSDTQSVSC